MTKAAHKSNKRHGLLISNTLAMLLVNAGLVITLPMAMYTPQAFAAANIVQCGTAVANNNVDCTVAATGSVGSLSALTVSATNLSAGTISST